MVRVCIVVSFAGFATCTVAIVHSCLVNRRQKVRGEVLEDRDTFVDYARRKPIGHLYDKPELPSDSAAQIYELPEQNVVEIGGQVLITHELHSKPLVELPGDARS